MTNRAMAQMRASLAFVAISATFVLALGVFGWWAAGNIDDRSMARETRAIRVGLDELLRRIPVEQDSAIIWSEAISHLKAGDDAWIADNIAEWLSSYFGHDGIYIIDPQGKVVRAVERGNRIPEQAYEVVRASIDPMVADLRQAMSTAAAETPSNSTEAVSGLGIEDFRTLPDGKVAIVSVRPILPSDDTLIQAASEEFLHVSVVELGADVVSAIGRKFEIDGLQFDTRSNLSPDRIGTPVLDNQGHIVGFFSWFPDEPAYQLIAETGPLMVLCAAFLMAAGALLVQRLQRTGRQLAEKEAQATFFAYHDPLTRLPNRAFFEEELARALANSRRAGGTVVLHCIDLDHFKSVNDTLGHPAGDTLLVQAAHRLGALVGEQDIVARLGGDEFALIQTHVIDMDNALSIAQRMVSALGQPFDINGHEVTVSASIGITASDNPDITPEDLIGRADLALYEAKGGGRSRYMLFGGELGAVVRDRLALETELREALQTGEGLELVYQPIFCATSGHILGAEALLRWQNPARGRLSPAVFIKLAEERGLIKSLGHWALHQACTYAASSNLPWIAVNVSPIQFRDERFVDRVFDVLTTTGLAPTRLEIEVTEGLLLQNSHEVQKTLRLLRAKGVRVALDDFGSGYSSISYLRTYGVDKLKIDQSFTAQLGHDEEIKSIVRSIIDLGKAMRMTLTAEGVETMEQRDILMKMGCDQLQGYLLSRPLAGDCLAELLGHGRNPRELVQ